MPIGHGCILHVNALQDDYLDIMQHHLFFCQWVCIRPCIDRMVGYNDILYALDVLPVIMCMPFVHGQWYAAVIGLCHGSVDMFWMLLMP